MRIKLIFLLCIFVLPPVTAAAQASMPLVVKVKEANIRNRPSTSGAVLGRAHLGDILSSTDFSNDWFYVAFGKTRGWVHRLAIRAPDDGEVTKSDFEGDARGRKSSIDYSSVYDDEWVEYDTSPKGREFYNPAKMSRAGLVVTVWTQTLDRSSGEVAMTTRAQINCSTNVARLPAGVVYRADGTVERSWDEANFKWRAIIPGTMIESLKQKVCKEAR